MYVQERLAQSAEELFNRLDAGAHIYFCGLKGMMPGKIVPLAWTVHADCIVAESAGSPAALPIASSRSLISLPRAHLHPSLRVCACLCAYTCQASSTRSRMSPSPRESIGTRGSRGSRRLGSGTLRSAQSRSTMTAPSLPLQIQTLTRASRAPSLARQVY